MLGSVVPPVHVCRGVLCVARSTGPGYTCHVAPGTECSAAALTPHSGPQPWGFSFQVRKDALRALNVAHTVSTQRSTVFPLDGIVRMLLFQDSDEATDFLSFHGLSVSDG